MFKISSGGRLHHFQVFNHSERQTDETKRAELTRLTNEQIFQLSMYVYYVQAVLPLGIEPPVDGVGQLRQERAQGDAASPGRGFELG